MFECMVCTLFWLTWWRGWFRVSREPDRAARVRCIEVYVLVCSSPSRFVCPRVLFVSGGRQNILVCDVCQRVTKWVPRQEATPRLFTGQVSRVGCGPSRWCTVALERTNRWAGRTPSEEGMHVFTCICLSFAVAAVSFFLFLLFFFSVDAPRERLPLISCLLSLCIDRRDPVGLSGLAGLVSDCLVNKNNLKFNFSAWKRPQLII